MTTRLRGIAAVAEAHVYSYSEGKVYLRRSLPVHAEVPIYVCGPEREATSYYATLERVGGYLVLDAKLLDDDDETDWLVDVITGGQHALSLRTHSEHGPYPLNDTGQRIETMVVGGVSLETMACCELCFAWIEEDGHITYQVPKAVFHAIQEYYESTGKPEPILDLPPNSFTEADYLDPPEEVPQGPIEGDSICFMKLVKSQGQVDLLIGSQGTMVGKMRAGPALIQSLRDMLAHYDEVFPAPKCYDEDDPDPEDEVTDNGDDQ